VVMEDGSVVPFKNRADRPDRFRTLGLELLVRYGWRAWWRGRGVSYLYHSHRQTTHPSQTDVTFMRVNSRRWPHVQHLIFTPDGRYEVWRLG